MKFKELLEAKTATDYTVQPKTRKELERIIKETIRKEGNECDLNFIDTSLITDMRLLFSGLKRFNGKIDKWDNQPIDGWNTSKVTSMAGMFLGASSFNQPIGEWNTSKVTDMTGMFTGAKSFNQPIGGWDTSNVKRIGLMFSGAKSFDQNISKWDVSNVTLVYDMFYGCPIKDEYKPDIEDL